MIHHAPSQPLSRVSAGRSVVLRCVHGGGGVTARLAAMGLLPGTTIHVHRNDRGGPVVIALHGERLMLGRGMAEQISVQDGHPAN